MYRKFTVPIPDAKGKIIMDWEKETDFCQSIIASRYDEAFKKLKDLQGKRREMQVAKLLAAIDKSGKIMEEVMRLIKL